MRKLKLYFRKYGTSVYSLAVILSLPVWLWSLHNFSQYELERKDAGNYGERRARFYADFDGDGLTEFVYCYPWKKDFFSFPVYSSKNDVIVQYNLKGSLSRNIGQSISLGDFDEDGYQEFCVISNIGDSLVLNIIEPLGKGHVVKNKFLGYTQEGKAGYDYEVFDSQLYDVDGDGTKEFVTMISGGFNLYPRNVYLYDISIDRLKVSKYLGAKNREMRISDLNMDGEPEFLISNFGAGNMRPPLPEYNDYNAYLYVLDKDLTPLFEPSVFEGETQHLQVYPVSFKDGNYWFVLNRRSSKINEEGYHLSLINYEGDIVKQKHYLNDGIATYLLASPMQEKGKNSVLVIRGDGNLYRLGRELNLERIASLPQKMISRFYPLDLDGNGDDEVVAYDRKGRYAFVFRNNFKSYIDIEIGAIPDFTLTSRVQGKYLEPAFYIQIGNHWFDLIYRKVPFFYLKAATRIVVIYLAVLLLVLLIQKITAGHDRRKKRLAELQLTSWKNQLDPHFTFNTLNSVGSVILSEERFKAYDFFSRFSKLVRYALEASSKVSVTLEEELRFIDLYLQLEKFRFKNKFEYEFQVDDDVNRKKQVPKMLLQTYVENAVRHGLMERKEKGLLLVKIYKAARHLVFHVEDNGIGRKAAARKKQLRNGIGMKVMQDYFDLLNSINDKSIKFKVLDSNAEDEKYPGTLVLILIPIGFSYKI